MHKPFLPLKQTQLTCSGIFFLLSNPLVLVSWRWSQKTPCAFVDKRFAIPIEILDVLFEFQEDACRFLLKNMFHCPIYKTMYHCHHCTKLTALKSLIHSTLAKLPHIMVDEKDLALFPTLMQTWPWLCHFFHMNEDEDMRIWVFVHSTHHSKIEWSVQIPGLHVLYFYMCWSISIGFSTKMLGLDGCVGYLWL
jgi:hypothetical protein